MEKSFFGAMKIYHVLEEGIPLMPSKGYETCKKTTKGSIDIPNIEYKLLDNISICTSEEYAQTGANLIPIGFLPSILPETDVTCLLMETFYMDRQGNLLYDTGSDIYKIANFTVKIRCKICVIGWGKTQEKICVYIHNANRKVMWSLLKSEWQFFMTKLKVDHPEFYLYVDYSNAVKVFQQYISSLYESQLPTLSEEIFYETAGWYEMPDGRMHYVSGRDENCNSMRRLADIGAQNEARELWNYGQGILQIGNLEALLPLFLQLHIGYTMAFFEKAGHPIQFLMTLIGPTGSRKTALARCLYCLFDNDEVVNFTATDRGIELAAMKCHDAVLVLDDLSASKDKQLVNKLNRFLRQIGDSAGRVKSINGGRDIERVDTRSAVVVTAESPLNCLQQSGQLRTLMIKITPSTIQNTKLREFQNERNLAKIEKRSSKLERYVSAYINFLEAKSEECLRYIVTFEPPALPLAFARQAEIYRSLSCMAMLVLNAGIYYQSITPEEAMCIYKQWLPVLWQVMKKNELQGQVSDPAYMFVLALSQLKATRALIVAEAKNIFQQNPAQYAGFYDQDMIYLKPDITYAAVQSYWKSLDLPMEVVSSDLFSRLLKLGISQGYEQKGHAAKKLKSITVNKEKMQILCLNWGKAMQYIQEHEKGGSFND